MRNEMIKAWRQASTAEILWTTPEGPRGTPVVPLVWPRNQTPCAAIPLSQLDEAESVTRGAALSVHTGGASPRTLLATGRVDVQLDLAGKDFVEHLLPQEVAKHPPTRLRADSLVARRENWWWLPRVLITLTETTRVRELPARKHAGDAVLVRGRSGDRNQAEGPSVTVVTAAEWAGPGQPTEIELWPRSGARITGDDEAAFAFGHRHSPDFERWERWYRGGTLRQETLYVSAGEGTPRPGDEHPGYAEPFPLLERLLNHRRTAKACKTGIAAAEKRQR